MLFLMGSRAALPRPALACSALPCPEPCWGLSSLSLEQCSSWLEVPCLAVHLGQQPLFLARLQAQLRDSTPTGLFFRAYLQANVMNFFWFDSAHIMALR